MQVIVNTTRMRYNRNMTERTEIQIAKNAFNAKGKKFFRLRAIMPVSRTKGNQIKWLMECDCGKQGVYSIHDVKSGHTRSCGCIRKEQLTKRNFKHGHSVRGTTDLTHQSWLWMTARINSPSYHAHQRYKDRGITICDRWTDKQNGFLNFLEDMGERTDPKHTLDRIDNDKGYYKENCRWTTMAVQCENRANTVRIEYKGRLMTIREIATEMGESYNYVYTRFRRYKV